MQIGRHMIGLGHPVYVVAEVSSNHCQDFTTARMLIEAAAGAGASAIKMQTFTPDEIAINLPILTGYDAAHDAWLARLGVTTLHGLYSQGGLPRPWHKALQHIAEDVGLHFLSTPFSVDAARFLVEEIGVPALKIASGDLTFTPLLEYAASTGLPLLVSTGMATMNEVNQAVFGPLCSVWEEKRLCVLHCTSSYPLDPRQANLQTLLTLHDMLRCEIGYSDHSTDAEILPALAVAFGSVVYEKHLRLDDAHGSPDAGHSLTVAQFARMVKVIRAVPQWLGDGVKQPQESEAHERLWTRRSMEDWLRPTTEARVGRWA